MKQKFGAVDWERAVVTQLYKEYRSILWQYRISLRPVAIQICDSNTHWGRWESLTRTIFIARKLVQNHSWFHVQSILKHEMAHQIVDEVYGPKGKDQKPHGELFQMACKQLGVLGEFTRASVQLQESNLDWRSKHPDEASEKLMDKVRKLLSLATSSNENEAYLAMHKVRELYAKYNLEQANEKKSNYFHIVITHGKKRIESHQERIMSILVEHFFVEVLTCNLFNSQRGECHRAIELIGTRENVLMAEYVYCFLLQQLDYWVNETVKTSGRKVSSFERKSFRLGILEGFSEKLRISENPQTEKGIASSNQEERGLTLIGMAISQFRKDQNLRKYLSGVYPRLTRFSSAVQYIDTNAYGMGKTIGKEITLNRAITGEGKNFGKLIGTI